MTKLYVTGSTAVMIPGYGTKQPGDYFDLPADEVSNYKDHPSFTTTAPKPTKIKASKPVSEDDES